MRDLYLQKRFDILLLMLAALFPIYKYSISSMVLSVFSITSIFLYYRAKTEINKLLVVRRLRYFLITTGFYLLMICSLSYSSDIKTGLAFLVSSAYILVYPLIIIFFVNDISKKQLNQILFCFVFSCCMYSLYIHYCFHMAGLYTTFKPAEFYDLPFRGVLMTLKVGSGHPTYISMWFLFSVLFLIHFLLENKVSHSKKIGMLFGITLLTFSSMLLSAKITVVAFFFSLLLLVYLMLKKKLIVVFVCGLITTIFVLSLLNISFLRARFIDEFKATEFKPPVGIRTNSLNIRVGIFECSKEIFKNNWLIGTGVGDAQAELNKCYSTFNTNVYKVDTYNSHNNYFGIAISTGSIGLFAFIFMLLFHIRESIKHGNTLFLIFLLFVIICMVPENILSRNHGVVFYSIFSSLFSKRNLENNHPA